MSLYLNPQQVVWGRCVAEAVGYPASEARPLGLAWAMLQERDLSPPSACETIVFAGHNVGVVVRQPEGDGEGDFIVCVGRRRCTERGYYRAVKSLSGNAHDYFVAWFSELLEPVDMVALDTRRVAARLWRER